MYLKQTFNDASTVATIMSCGSHKTQVRVLHSVFSIVTLYVTLNYRVMILYLPIMTGVWDLGQMTINIRHLPMINSAEGSAFILQIRYKRFGLIELKYGQF